MLSIKRFGYTLRGGEAHLRSPFTGCLAANKVLDHKRGDSNLQADLTTNAFPTEDISTHDVAPVPRARHRVYLLVMAYKVTLQH